MTNDGGINRKKLREKWAALKVAEAAYKEECKVQIVPMAQLVYDRGDDFRLIQVKSVDNGIVTGLDAEDGKESLIPAEMFIYESDEAE
jgi:hypothetical protein